MLDTTVLHLLQGAAPATDPFFSKKDKMMTPGKKGNRV